MEIKGNRDLFVQIVTYLKTHENAINIENSPWIDVLIKLWIVEDKEMITETIVSFQVALSSEYDNSNFYFCHGFLMRLLKELSSHSSESASPKELLILKEIYRDNFNIIPTLIEGFKLEYLTSIDHLGFQKTLVKNKLTLASWILLANVQASEKDSKNGINWMM